MGLQLPLPIKTDDHIDEDGLEGDDTFKEVIKIQEKLQLEQDGVICESLVVKMGNWLNRLTFKNEEKLKLLQ